MPLRLSGLISGMDTEGIVAELMKAQRMKSTRIENKITTLEWKQEKWKALNAKLYSFYTGPLSKIKMQGNFNTKKTSSSNEDKLEVKASTTAPEGTQKVQILGLASSQFITGSKLDLDDNGKAINTGTKLVDLGFNASEGTVINIEAGGKKVNLDIGSSTTIKDFTDALKDAGLNATYDTIQKRFFISSKDSGNVNSFSITSTSSEYAQDRNAIRDYINYGAMSTTQKDTVDSALLAYVDTASTTEDKATARTNILTAAHTQVRAKFIADYKADTTNIDAVTAEERLRLESELGEGETLDEAVLKAAVDKKLAENAEIAVTTEYNAWVDQTAPDTNVFKTSEVGLDNLLADYETNTSTGITQTNSLTNLGLSEINRTTNPDGTFSVSADPNVNLIQATDAKMIYNGAEITSTSNTITANGLTFTLKGISDTRGTADTADDEEITIGVNNDTQAVYDTVKNFVKAYNELIKEMNDSYYADSAKGYDPLTDEEKDAMSESQIEKWEDKIKNSLLRRDNTISSIMSTMRSTLSKSVQVDGKSYSLSSFGVTTVGYTEKGILHIHGDSEDTAVSAIEDKLMKALTEDPDTVMTVFNQLGEEVYKTMSKQMSSTTLSSALTFYQDKEMKSTMTNYQTDLKRLEEKLEDMENRYFKQFAAMESAMSKMNSQSASLASMLGQGQ